MRNRDMSVMARVVLFFFLAAVPGWSLPLGEREASHFSREVVKILAEVVSNEAELAGGDIEVTLDGKTIHQVPIQAATVTFKGFSSSQFNQMRQTGVDINKLLEGGSVEADVFISASAINSLIEREISRIKAQNRIFDKMSLKLLNNQVRVTGKVDFRKIPGNILGFLSTDLSPFTATIKLEQNGSQINIDIIDAKVNDQPMTSELRQQILSWLNPVWDFSILPYPANLKTYTISSEGVAFAGNIFD